MKFKSEVQLEALNNATVDTDKFLVSDSTTIKYRTGTQLLSDLGVSGLYVPYTGATGNVDLGTHTLSSYNLIVNHTSGSGVAASITKGGNGEALTINKTSGSGNAMSVLGGLTSLVDLTLSSIPNATIDTDRFIVSDGGAIKYRTGAQVLSDIGGQPALTNPITGSGTTNYVSKFTGATTLGNSVIYNNGSSVAIGDTSTLSSGPWYGGLSLGKSGTDKVVVGYLDSMTSGAVVGGHNSALNAWANLNIVGGDVIFRGGEVERMRILEGGNVGIGTTTPATKLTVEGILATKPVGVDAYYSYLRSNWSADNAFELGISAFGSSFYHKLITSSGYYNGETLQFWTNDSERARFDISGNFGIGTTSPSAGLQINRSSWGLGGSNVSRMLQKSVGIAGDYEQHVILLHPIYNGTLIDYNKCSGTIYASRGGTGMGLINDTYDIDTASAYSSYNGTVNSTIGYGRLYTCDYNGVKYVALLPDYRTSSVQYDFDGYIRSTGEELKVVVYRLSNSGTIINSEVNSSLTLFSAGITYYQGNVYTAGSFVGNLSGTADQTSVTFSNSGATFESFFNSQAWLTDKNYLIYNTSDAPRGGLGLYTVAMNNWDAAYGSMFAIDCEPGQGIGYIKTKYGGSFGAWKMIIDNASNQTIGGNKNFTNDLCVGTTVPLLNTGGRGNITINGSSESILTLANGGVWKSYFFNNGTDTIIGAANSITFGPGGGFERMRITSSGSVGIGTTSPGALLDVNGSIYSRSGSILSNNFGGYSGSDVNFTTNTSGGANLIFKTSLTERMRIDSGGNVGIGTTAPQAKLHINNGTNRNLWFRDNGNGTGTELLSINDAQSSRQSLAFSASSFYFDNGNVGIGTTSPLGKLTVKEGATYFEVNTDIADTSLLSFNRDLGSYRDFNFRARDFIFSPSDVEKVRITNAGNVGIGTTSPGSKLTVDSGDVTLTNGNLYVAVGSGNDYSSKLSTALNYPQVDTYLDSIGGSSWEGRLNFRTSSNGGSLTTKMTILDSGNVGIGTTDPLAKLHVIGTVLSTAGPLGGVFAMGSNAIRIEGNPPMATMSFFTGNTERARFSQGNFGIGTTSPGAKLDVFGTSRISATTPTQEFFSTANGDVWVSIQGVSGTGSGGSLSISTKRNGDSLTEKVRILDNGNVGIGTTSPGAKLDVNGSIRGFGAGNAGRITSTDTSGGGASIAMNPQFSTGVPGIESIGAFPIAFQTNSSEKMRITSSGNVGINTTAPIHKLSVNGKIGGDVWSAGYIEFLSTTETVISAESNVVLGYAQNVVVDNEGSLGVGTISPAACAIVDIQSTNQGFLPPRMRTSERDNILGTPKPGLMIFNTDDEVVQVYTNGSGWRTLAFL